MADEYYDIQAETIKVDDIANLQLLGKINHKSIKLMYFTHTENALWAADRAVRSLCFPAFEVRLKVNREAFDLYPGQCFKWSSTKYGITDMVVRIQEIDEGALDDEFLTITCIRDPNYVTTAVSVYDSSGYSSHSSPDASLLDVDPLVNFKVLEAPYVLVGDVIRVTPLAARVSGKEARYVLYMSLDGGTSYTSLVAVNNFIPHGTLVSAYRADRTRIDDKWGFTFDASYNADWSSVESITRDSLFAGYNMALIGEEIVCFQTITPDPVVSGRYHVIGIWGGRFDTEIVEHAAGEDFWFIGTTAFSQGDANMLVGSDIYFKPVPATTLALGDISEAPSDSVTIRGRGKAPYPVANLRANDELAEEYPIYDGGEDVVLTWDARVRGQGAGSQLPEETDSPGTYEGEFRVDVLMDAAVVRSTTGITAETWTYTDAMNIADGGPKDLTIRVYNYIAEVGVTYTSLVEEITVTLV